MTKTQDPAVTAAGEDVQQWGLSWGSWDTRCPNGAASSAVSYGAMRGFTTHPNNRTSWYLPSGVKNTSIQKQAHKHLGTFYSQLPKTGSN